MAEEKAQLAKQVNKKFLDKKGNHFVCPDGNPRQLSYVEVANDHLKLEFSGIRADVAASVVNWPCHEVDTRFRQYTPISATQAKKYKDAGTLVIASEDSQQALSTLESAKLLFDPNDDLHHVTSGLRTMFDKVASDPRSIPQAQTMNEVGKTIIDAYRVKAGILKTIVDAQASR